MEAPKQQQKQKLKQRLKGFKDKDKDKDKGNNTTSKYYYDAKVSTSASASPYSTTHEVTPKDGGFTRDNLEVDGGSVHGYLYRFYGTLHTWKRFYYVLSIERGLLFEYNDASGRDKAKNVLEVAHARLQNTQKDEGQYADSADEASAIAFYTFNVIFRSRHEGKAPKILALGACSNQVRTQWLNSFRDAGVNEERSLSASTGLAALAGSASSPNANSYMKTNHRNAHSTGRLADLASQRSEDSLNDFSQDEINANTTSSNSNHTNRAYVDVAKPTEEKGEDSDQDKDGDERTSDTMSPKKNKKKQKRTPSSSSSGVNASSDHDSSNPSFVSSSPGIRKTPRKDSRDSSLNDDQRTTRSNRNTTTGERREHFDYGDDDDNNTGGGDDDDDDNYDGILNHEVAYGQFTTRKDDQNNGRSMRERKLKREQESEKEGDDSDDDGDNDIDNDDDDDDDDDNEDEDDEDIQRVEVFVDDQKFEIKCHPNASNAWLLSEVIRRCVDYNESRSDDEDQLSEPKIEGLVNRSRGNLRIDLGEDVSATISPGDVVVAIVMPNNSNFHSRGSTSSRTGNRIASELGINPSLEKETNPQTLTRHFEESHTINDRQTCSKSSDDMQPTIIEPSTGNASETGNKVVHKTESELTVHQSHLPETPEVTDDEDEDDEEVEEEVEGEGEDGILFKSEKAGFLTKQDGSPHITSLSAPGPTLPAPSQELFVEFADVAADLDEVLSHKIPYWTANHWREHNIINGVRLFRPASDWRLATFQGVGASTLINAAPVDVFEQVLNVHAQREWDPLFASAKILEANVSSDVVEITTKKLSFFSSPRRLRMKRLWYQRKRDDAFVIAMKEAHDPLVAELNDPQEYFNQRACLKGGFIILPAASSSSAASSSNEAPRSVLFFFALGNSSLNGWIPSNFEKPIWDKWASSIGGLRDLLEFEPW